MIFILLSFAAGSLIQLQIMIFEAIEAFAATVPVNEKIISVIAVASLVLLGITGSIIIMNRKKIKLADIALDRLNHEFNAKAEELGQLYKKLTDLSAFKEVMIIFLAHDLKNTLNTLLNSEIKIDPIQQLSGIRITGRHMLNGVDNMLGIIGFENGSITLNIQAVSYNTLLMNVFRRIKIQSASRNITLSYNHEKNYTLAADADISERILVNLLDNAIRHTPAGSSIDVTAEMLDGFIKTTVKDRGDGIAPGLLPFIFEKYTRGDNAGQGAARRYGLGLAFCKMAVEKHGGTTGAISEQGKGSEIWFTLPLASVDVIQPAHQTKPAMICDLQELPEFTEEELSWLREHYGRLRHISIHQISDIKDLLDMPDAGASAAICRWKNAVIAAMNQYNVSSFNHLVDLIK